MQRFLTGERIYLRALEREDMDEMLTWMSDPEIRYLSLMEELPQNRSKAGELFEKMNKEAIPFAICLNDDRLIGMLRLALHLRNATIGITIGDRAYWSRGYGTEATRLALDYCFNTLNLHRVELWVFEYNDRAINCYKKLGFRKEGTGREAVYKNGRYVNVVNMGILKKEWRATDGTEVREQ
jgi:RimJ/RimL family protein N-acetyltransferase